MTDPRLSTSRLFVNSDTRDLFFVIDAALAMIESDCA